MPRPHRDWDSLLKSPVLQGEMDYDPIAEQELASTAKASLTEEQRRAFDEITAAVRSPTPETNIFFLHGATSMGKTYLYNTLCHEIRGNDDVILCIASSGIASLLLPDGRTAHYHFKIPLNPNETATCNISKSSAAADLLRRTDLIIWDEAPMLHRYYADAIDRILQDICDDSIHSFEGILTIFGGDFAPILPVVQHGSRAAIVNSCLLRSYLWPSIRQLHLTKNMRLSMSDEDREYAE